MGGERPRRRFAGLAAAALLSVVALGPALLPAALSAPHSAVPASRPSTPSPILRVCADPNNLPFSNLRMEGFENRVAELLAAELGASLEYVWWAQRRGFLRNTLGADACDVVLGIPATTEAVLATEPWYRSTYVAVARRDGPRIRSLDDPALRRVRVGVHLIGDDYANTPPAEALARRGIVENVVGFPIYGDYREANPPARLIEAVANGGIDVAIVWGPFAGYFAPRQQVPLVVRRIPDSEPGLPLAFDIAMGVRKGDDSLRRRLETAVVQRRAQIDSVLTRYGVLPG